jgi:4-oxalocrotonate tautomerase
MPIITVNLIAGRTAETKRDLLRALTDAAVASLGVPRQTVRVLLTEIQPEHWAVGGEAKQPVTEATSG